MASTQKFNVDLGIGPLSELDESKDVAVFRECTRIRIALMNLAQAVSNLIGADYDSQTDTLAVTILRGNANGNFRLRGRVTNVLGVSETGAGVTGLGLFNKANTPQAQPTTAITGATYGSVAGTGLTANDTFDGYTVAQVVAALRQLGVLA